MSSVALKHPLFLVIALAAGLSILSGCEPAPSTALAPDQKQTDLTKLSGKELLELKKTGKMPAGH